MAGFSLNQGQKMPCGITDSGDQAQDELILNLFTIDFRLDPDDW